MVPRDLNFLTLALGDWDVTLGWDYWTGNTHLSLGVWLAYSFLFQSFANLFFVPHIPSCQRNGMWDGIIYYYFTIKDNDVKGPRWVSDSTKNLDFTS